MLKTKIQVKAINPRSGLKTRKSKKAVNIGYERKNTGSRKYGFAITKPIRINKMLAKQLVNGNFLVDRPFIALRENKIMAGIMNDIFAPKAIPTNTQLGPPGEKQFLEFKNKKRDIANIISGSGLGILM